MNSAAPWIQGANRQPQAALAQPVSDSVQCRSFGVRSSQYFPVILWARPYEAWVCRTILGEPVVPVQYHLGSAGRAARAVEQQVVVGPGPDRLDVARGGGDGGLVAHAAVEV